MPQRTSSSRAPLGRGAYILLFRNTECTITIGALGERVFLSGWHGYIGSALGASGFARVRRHRLMYINKDRTPRWHVDYLLLDPHFRLYSLICGPCEDDVECHLAEALCGGGVQGFGCSDCACYSHLFFRKKDPCHEVITTFQKLGITPAIKTIKNPGDDGKICKCSVSQGVCERKETPLN